MKHFLIRLIKQPISLRRGVFYLLFSTSFLSVFAMTVLWISTEVKNNKILIHDVKERTLQNQKQQIKHEIENALLYVKDMGNIHHGSYQKEVEQMVLNHLQQIRFGYSGYIFVNTIDGHALIFDGKKVVNKKNIKNLTDSNGLKLFPLECEAALKPNGGYIRYSFKKMNDTLPHPKISYIAYYKPWGWIIGAGDYIDDANQKIQSLQSPIITKVRLKITSILLILVAGTLILYFFSNYTAKQIVNQTDYFIRFLKDPSEKTFDSKNFFIKELNTISQNIIEIEDSKRAVENELRKHKEHLEDLIKERTEELELKNKKLEYFHELFINREFRIKELRDEVKALKQQLNNKV